MVWIAAEGLLGNLDYMPLGTPCLTGFSSTCALCPAQMWNCRLASAGAARNISNTCHNGNSSIRIFIVVILLSKILVMVIVIVIAMVVSFCCSRTWCLASDLRVPLLCFMGTARM